MLAPSNCWSRQCKWYVGIIQPDGTEMTETNFCGAFPNGIPPEISYGDDLHDVVKKKQAKPYIYEKSDNWKDRWDNLPEDDVAKWQGINSKGEEK
jgi:hypothetical protein